VKAISEFTQPEFYGLSEEEIEQLVRTASTPEELALIQKWELDPTNPRLSDADKEFLEDWKNEEALERLMAETHEAAKELYDQYIQPLIDAGLSQREALLTIIKSYAKESVN
jgi:hypothetical protein